MTGYIGGDFGDYRNFELLTNCLLKLNGEEELAAIQSKSSKDNTLSKITDQAVFNKYKSITNVVLFVILPLLILLAMTLVFILHYRRLNYAKK